METKLNTCICKECNCSNYCNCQDNCSQGCCSECACQEKQKSHDITDASHSHENMNSAAEKKEDKESIQEIPGHRSNLTS